MESGSKTWVRETTQVRMIKEYKLAANIQSHFFCTNKFSYGKTGLKRGQI